MKNNTKINYPDYLIGFGLGTELGAILASPEELKMLPILAGAVTAIVGLILRNRSTK